MRYKYLPYVLILPAVSVVAITIVVPFIRTIMMSFSEWYLFAETAKSGTHPFLGFANYRGAFGSSLTWDALRNSLFFIVGCLAIEIGFGMVTALLMNEAFSGRGVARMLSLIPFAIPAVPWALAWVIMLYYDGVINNLLAAAGLIEEGFPFLGRTASALPTVIAVRAFKLVPFMQIMLLSGLSAISDELYEAARVDGASAWRRFWSITLPQLRPVLIVTTLIVTVWHINDFALVWVMTQGGPGNATELIVMKAYKLAFQAYRFGESSAVGVVLLISGLILGYFYLKLTRAFE